jgi:hypothetical protein
MGIVHLIKSWKESQMSPSLLMIKKELLRKQQVKTALPNRSRLSRRDQQLIDEIMMQTARRNQNNITRTMSYLDFYRKHPEIRWAFLGHMVSRNGGWNMTDLKGELLTKLLSEQEQKDYFHFLERGNWLIFQDVYPQFLLYEESVKRRVNLFYLLPFFQVSIFMEVLWNYFWTSKDEYSLATALIINEQNYLEKRVIQNSSYRKTVLNTIEFKLQDLLSLNQILFPCEPVAGVDHLASTALIGETLHHFASLHERISLGKRLYHLLFHPQHLVRVQQWALKQRHTGSRKDFWPQLFNHVRETAPGLPYEKRIEDCQLKPGTKRLHSPMLYHAWKDVEHPPAEACDWYEDWKMVRYLNPLTEEAKGDIKNAYCKTLENIEMAIVAREFFSPK